MAAPKPKELCRIEFSSPKKGVAPEGYEPWKNQQTLYGKWCGSEKGVAEVMAALVHAMGGWLRFCKDAPWPLLCEGCTADQITQEPVVYRFRKTTQFEQDTMYGQT